MLTAALDLSEKLGFSIIPLRRDKKPYLSSWKEFQTRHATEEEITAWFTKYPDANIGIVTGAISGLVVVDADGDAGLAWMKKNMPTTGVYVKTGKGWHGYYKYSEHVKNRVRLAPEVDIRADGGYVVAPPSVHANGTQYTFQFTPGLNGWDDLAPYKPVVAEGLLPDLSDVSLPVSTAPVAKGERNNTLARIAGMYFGKGLNAQEVFALCMAWNGTLDEPLSEHEVRITVGSIGKTHRENHPTESAALPEVVPAAPAKSTQAEFPPEVLNPGGILQALMEYTEKAAAVSHPVYALGGAIAMLGTLAGQKYQTETGLRTNFYCLAIGDSGTGKDSPQKALPELFTKTRAAMCLGPNAITSEAAVLRYLSNEQKARSLFILDEIGLLLTAMRRPTSPAAEVPSLLMKLWSATDRGYAKSYADSKNDVYLNWHHLSLYGASTPMRFWESLTSSDATDGFLARCLIFESAHEKMRPKKHIDKSISAELAERINALADFMPPMAQSGNLISLPDPIRISKTDDAQNFFDQWADKYFDLSCGIENESLEAIYNRAAEHAHKLALVHAVSLCGTDVKEVDLPSVTWACGLVDVLLKNMVRNIADNVADNDFHKLTQQIRHVIARVSARNKYGYCPLREIHNRIYRPNRELDEALKHLEMAGLIMKHTPNATDKRIRGGYILAQPAEDM